MITRVTAIITCAGSGTRAGFGYNKLLKDLGEEVKVGAAGLIMAILGGAVITPIMGKMIDTGILSSIVPAFTGAQAAVRSSFLIPVICFAVVLVYSLCFRTKKEA